MSNVDRVELSQGLTPFAADQQAADIENWHQIAGELAQATDPDTRYDLIDQQLVLQDRIATRAEARYPQPPKDSFLKRFGKAVVQHVSPLH